MMDVLDYLVILNGAVSLFLGYFILTRGAKNRVTFSLASCAIFTGIWAVVLYMYHFQLLLSSFLWIKIVYLLAFILVFNLLYFSLIFPYKSRISILFPSIIYFIFSIPLLYILFFTKLWIEEVVYKPWGPETVLGPFYVFVTVFWGIFGIWTLYNLIKKYLVSTAITREKIKYVLVGVSLFILIIMIVDGIIPILAKNTQYFRISPLSSLFFVGFTAYAILRYRLMDIRLVISRGVVYFLTLATLIGLGFFMLFLNSKLAIPLSVNIVGPLAMVVGILLFQLVFRFFEKLASKYFYYTFYSYQKVLTELGEKLTRILDLNHLADVLLSTLQGTMKLDKTVILQRKEAGDYTILKNIGFREENGISLVKDNFLTQYLGRTRKPLVYEELNLAIRDIHYQAEREKLEELKKNMKKIEAAVCLPLFREEKIIGMIVLGNKISGDAYSQQDLELLTTLSGQASIAFQNAVFYSQVQDLSQNLQQKVDEQTKKLREAYEELKVLDKAKTEFISIASHQLRTPLTAIKGYISMLLEEDYGELPSRAKAPIGSLYQSNERLIKLVNGLLNISRIETGKIAVKRQPVLIESVISSSLEELKPQAQMKKIYLKFEKPKTKIPQVWADKDKLKEVLLNVVDNGIRYTSKGGITIKLKIQKDKLRIIISDTGEGMTKEELSKIFQTFSRGRAGTRFWVEGVGLGLYIAKRFTELQGGKIWAESEGKGKGSTFYVELPIK